MSPDAMVLTDFLRAARVRLRLGAWLQGSSVGAAISLLVAIITFLTSSLPMTAAIVLAVAGALAGALIAWLRADDALRTIEQRIQSRNLITTAAELIDRPRESYVEQRVLGEAAQLVRKLDAAALFPTARAWTAALGVVALWSAALLGLATQPPALRAIAAGSPSDATAKIDQVEVVIIAPNYMGLANRSLTNPARIDAPAGSQIRLRVRSNAAVLRLETVDQQFALAEAEDGFTGVIAANGDGFIALQPINPAGQPGARRLIGLSVQPDQVPRVRITAPGRDLHFADARRAIDIAVDALDDHALASLELHYTRVSGSGEQFSFTEGTLPLQVARSSARNWKATGRLALGALNLTAGDMVVYRALALDRRPGARAAESDAFIIEITAPGSTPMEGFSGDDEDKYALSQQMVILKTERLLARAPTMPAESLAYAAASLAAEQRSVRAEFVFMMGGELAEEVLEAAGITDLNEEAHAEADEELLAGRLANQGRNALVLAIRSMSRASTALNDRELQRALTEEKAALDQLQRAFSRTRYILRALTRRERLDLSRRLTGSLAGVLSMRQPAPGAEPNPRADALRNALRSLAELSGELTLTAETASRASLIGQRLLQIDPSDPLIQRTATQLDEAGKAIAQQRRPDAVRLFDQAALSLTTLLRAEVASAPGRAQRFEHARLNGAMLDALHRREPPR